MLPCTGRVAPLDLLQEVQWLKTELKEREASEICITDRILQLVDGLGEDGWATFLNLVQGNLECSACRGYKLLYNQVQLVTSARCLGYATLMMDNASYGDSVYLKTNEKKNICQNVASPLFFGSSRRRFDVIMMENTVDNFHAVPENIFPIWLAKPMHFIQLPSMT